MKISGVEIGVPAAESFVRSVKRKNVNQVLTTYPHNLLSGVGLSCHTARLFQQIVF
jgi:hypothetical protein